MGGLIVTLFGILVFGWLSMGVSTPQSAHAFIPESPPKHKVIPISEFSWHKIPHHIDSSMECWVLGKEYGDGFYVAAVVMEMDDGLFCLGVMGNDGEFSDIIDGFSDSASAKTQVEIILGIIQGV